MSQVDGQSGGAWCAAIEAVRHRRGKNQCPQQDSADGVDDIAATHVVVTTVVGSPRHRSPGIDGQKSTRQHETVYRVAVICSEQQPT